MSNSKTTLFEQAPVQKAFFALALPSVFGKLIMLLYNLADTWFIASTNDSNIVAGVSLVAPVFMVMIALGDIFGVGGSSLISRLMGNRQKEDSKRVSALCFYSALILGVILTILLLILKNPLLVLLGTNQETISHAAAYYTYIAIGAPFILTCVVPMNLLRAEGMAKASMFGSITGSIVNIILDPLFIFGFQMGAAGAAIATVIGNAASLFVYSIFYHKAEWISISPKFIQYHPTDMKNIFSIGIPAALNNMMTSFTTTITNRFLVIYGNDVLAAWSLAGRCIMIPRMLLVSFSFSSLPLVGYNYGQKNFVRLKQILKFIYTFELCLALASSILITLFAPNMLSVFMDDSYILTTGTHILRCQVLGIAFTAVILISTCVFQAIGNGKATMITTLSQQLFIFLPVLFIASKCFGYEGILFAQPITNILTTILVLFLLKKNFSKN